MGIPVWLLASSFEPRGSSIYTLHLATRLPEYGYDPTIVCSSAAHIPARMRPQLQIVEIPWLMHRVLGHIGIRRLINQTKEPPALVHAQHRGLADQVVTFAGRLDRPYLLTVHNLLPPEGVLPVLADRLAGIVAISPSVERDLVLQCGVPAELVTMIPNGVQPPPMPRLPAPRSANAIPVVGAASALEPIKGLAYFLLSAELILSAGCDVEFLIAGSGPDEEDLRRATQILDIANRVTFVGYVHEYRQILETFDVFVMPSLEQGLGTVMLEAMALGKPVVATRVGGIADFFIDGVHAMLVPPANHVVLAEKIQYLLDCPDKARTLAAAGQQFVRDRFSVERMVRETADLYQAVMQQAAAA